MSKEESRTQSAVGEAVGEASGERAGEAEGDPAGSAVGDGAVGLGAGGGVVADGTAVVGLGFAARLVLVWTTCIPETLVFPVKAVNSSGSEEPIASAVKVT